MMKKTIAYYIDSIMSKVLLFFPGLLLARYFTGVLPDIFAFATVFSLCASGLYMLLISRTFRKKPDKREAALKRQFLYSDDRFALEFFLRSFQNRYPCTRNRKFIGVSGSALYCRFSAEELKADTVNDMYLFARKRGFKRMLILTIRPSIDALRLAAELPDMRASIFDFDRVIALMDWLNAYPELTLPAPAKASGARSLLQSAVAGKKSNAYLLSGAVLIVMSRFSVLSVYYLVVGSALIALCAGIKLYGFLKRRTESA